VPGDRRRWLREASEKFTVLPLTPEIALRSTELDWAWKDPADRLIVATALEHGLALITRDRQIARWGGVKVLW